MSWKEIKELYEEICRKIKEIWNSKPTPTPSPTPSPTPTPEPTPNPTPTPEPTDKLIWISGPKPNNPAQDVTITYVKHSANMFYYKQPILSWEPRNGDCVGICALFVKQEDGTFRGCKFDHIRKDTSSRDWKNVRGGYGGLSEPADGQECKFLIMDYDGKHISNSLNFNWKRATIKNWLLSIFNIKG